MTRRSRLSITYAAASAAVVVSAFTAGTAYAEPSATASTSPTKAELGEMLKKCSDEADARGLTVQKGKGVERKTYRRACMAKNGVQPKKS